MIPGGVNSPVRAFGAVGGDPLFVTAAKGSKITDADGVEYIDYVGSWGPAILGHAHPEVVESVCSAAQLGLSFGAPTERETHLARCISEALPSMERLRFVSSGTEACMSALRVARGFTGREKIVKFEGNYHGHADMLLVKAGSGAATFGHPSSAGVPSDATKTTLTAPYNDLDFLKSVFEQNPSDIAAVIIEPVAGNAGFIRPVKGFLSGIRALCDQYGALLIIDEVMTGFRVAFGGMQLVEGVRPDLCTLGKVIGGGMPLAAFGGRADIMEVLSPLGPVYQAGTLSGNPVATACGLKTLELIKKDPDFYGKLHEKSRFLMNGIEKAAKSAGIPVTTDFEGGMFGMYFSSSPVLNFSDAQETKIDWYRRYFNLMLDNGIYLAPSAYEAGFVSMAHSQEDLEATVKAAEASFQILADEVRP